MRLIVDAPNSDNRPHADSQRAIQDSVKRGLRWNQDLVEGKASSIKQIAIANNTSEFYVSQAIRMAFLSPTIIKRIFKGEIPFNFTLYRLKSI